MSNMTYPNDSLKEIANDCQVLFCLTATLNVITAVKKFLLSNKKDFNNESSEG